MFKVTARDQGHYKGPSGAFVTYCNITYCNISCFFVFFFLVFKVLDLLEFSLFFIGHHFG